MKSDDDMFKVWSFGPTSMVSLFRRIDARAPDDHPKKIADIEHNKCMEKLFKTSSDSIARVIDNDIIDDVKKTYTNKSTVFLKWFNKNEK